MSDAHVVPPPNYSMEGPGRCKDRNGEDYSFANYDNVATTIDKCWDICSQNDGVNVYFVCVARKIINYFDKTIMKDVFNLTELKLLFSILLVT